MKGLIHSKPCRRFYFGPISFCFPFPDDFLLFEGEFQVFDSEPGPPRKKDKGDIAPGPHKVMNTIFKNGSNQM